MGVRNGGDVQYFIEVYVYPEGETLDEIDEMDEYESNAIIFSTLTAVAAADVPSDW